MATNEPVGFENSPVEVQDFRGRKNPSFWGHLLNVPYISKENMKDHNIKPVGVGNTRILTDCAQKSPRNTGSETKWRVLRGP